MVRRGNNTDYKIQINKMDDAHSVPWVSEIPCRSKLVNYKFTIEYANSDLV